MNRQQFIDAVTGRLAYLPLAETEKFIDFYIEAIDDRIEDGMSEEEAVAAMGSIDSVVHAIESEIPLSTIVKQRVKSSRERSERDGGHSAWWIVLAVLGSPVWLTLACVLLALVVTVFAVAPALVVTAFAVLVVFAVTAVLMLVYSVSRLLTAGLSAALMCLGLALLLAGAGAALLSPCVMLARLMVKLPLRFWRWIKGLFIDRGRNEP